MSDSNTFEIVGAILALVAVLLAVFYAIHRLRLKQRKLRLELHETAGAAEDRAYNQIRIARSEVEILERSGADVSRPRLQLDNAQHRFDLKDYAEAISLAAGAHQALVELRSQPTRLPPGGTPSVPAPTTAGRRETGVGPARRTSGGPPGDPTTSAPPKLARNRAESHFQLTLLAEDVDRVRTAPTPPPGFATTVELQRQATSAYSSGDYTESLRLALRARRALGAQLESLPAPRTPSVRPSAETDESTPSAVVGDTSTTDEESATTLPAATCPQCGKPTREGDRFCRSCGAPRTPARCPRCGILTTPNDTFCGACGSPLA